MAGNGIINSQTWCGFIGEVLRKCKCDLWLAFGRIQLRRGGINLGEVNSYWRVQGKWGIWNDVLNWLF